MTAPALVLMGAAVVVPSIGPYRGWRSWNQMGPAINQTQHEAIAAALADRSRLVDGKPTSLLDLGFNRIGMDDNWQACGAGVNGSFHSADGTPLWDTARFPDVRAMNEKIHRLGLKSDWYINNCICPETGKLSPGVADAGNARALPELGFDGVKIDGCGPDRNVTRFAELVDKASGGRTITIEDCNDDPDWDRGSADCTQFHDNGCAVSGGGFYRVAGDIFGYWEAIMDRVQQMAGYLKPVPWHTPLQRPGCWPSPDALEVGCTRQGPLGLNFSESRSHFGMWVVTSSPLILALDLRDKTVTDFAWPLITNSEVLAVHAAWPRGPPGTTRRQDYSPGTMVATDAIFSAGRPQNMTWQVWAKNVSASSVAVLLVNAGDKAQDVSVQLGGASGIVPCRPVGLCTESHMEALCAPSCSTTVSQAYSSGIKVTARDLWKRAPLPDVTGTFVATQLPPHDSAFVLFSRT